jgi:hypothetical protein
MARHGIVPMSWERYNAFVAWTRSPIVHLVGHELEYFSNKAETLIGVVILDRADRDFGLSPRRFMVREQYRPRRYR